MKNKLLKQLLQSGIFIALGVIIPIIFHSIGAGSIFLPMHIPVLLAGFIVSLPFSIAVGIITPLISSFLTGMPPIFPVLPYMVFELAAYGAVANIMYSKLKLNIFVSLLSSMVAGRIVAALAVWVLTTFFVAKLPSPFIFITGAITHGIPGIIIQIVLIPVIIMALYKSNLIERESVLS